MKQVTKATFLNKTAPIAAHVFSTISNPTMLDYTNATSYVVTIAASKLKIECKDVTAEDIVTHYLANGIKLSDSKFTIKQLITKTKSNKSKIMSKINKGRELINRNGGELALGACALILLDVDEIAENPVTIINK